ncbi:hypothetical protein DV735_g5157, partial [Chaetothyriales sp. CBS 134920]
MLEPIAIIGSACRFPGRVSSPSKLWELLREPRDLSSEPPASRFNIDAFYHPVGTHPGTTNARKSYWLDDNVAHFDAAFFNIQATEALAMDPQQRLLLEVVYDGLSSAGLPMERLRGSDTAVYVGAMCEDYNLMVARDWENTPRYAPMGLSHAILANRISYFFDWHGPSLNIDTACSSSLVALDQAMQALRSGKSKVAVAAGTSLILSPDSYISESAVGMLSPSGRCAMWDSAADGYARGEGVAMVLIKPLSAALADNDPIQGIIRETAVNQDGRTSGLTVPSHIAQASLITECYARAGLDPIRNAEDRPQFFQAHGTGTQAGDPQEAQAISTALFPSGVQETAEQRQKLLVGSVKTIIGHTEGTAGLAGVIASVLALKNGIVPPNLHFSTLSPKVLPFYRDVEIPTRPTAWPTTQGGIRRVSVNSFGFGGTNAHCILEEFVPEAKAPPKQDTVFTPLVFSAASETALRKMIADHLDYLKTNPNVDLASLAYTLQHRRSTLQYRRAVPARSIQGAFAALEDIASLPSDHGGENDLATRFGNPSNPAIIGIFTGQGAQWPRMGVELLELSAFGASRIAELDTVLQALPMSRPAWTLRDQLLQHKEGSRIQEAEISQPLCTAVQIVLVDILHAAGIEFSAVVGHSSGEIAAAYAAGFVSAEDAIRIAYLRGINAHLAASPRSRTLRGAMLAVEMSFEEAQTLCHQVYDDHIQVAAVNSSSSITLSGDEDAIMEAENLCRSREIFARRLKVDTAYHSSHMLPCTSPYLRSLDLCGVTGQQQPSNRTRATSWFSSVYRNKRMAPNELTNQYWVDNMCNTVLFADAIAQACSNIGSVDLAIEIGPHPALKGPCTSVLEEVYPARTVPYTGLLSRDQSDIERVSLALGFIWTRLGANSVQFSAVERLLSGNRHKTVLDDLPPYPFDHDREFWTTSRLANHFKHRRGNHSSNPILGNPCSEAVTSGEFQWRNILSPGDLYWLNGHMLQGQTVFPATGYVSMAIEAVKSLAIETYPDTVISMLQLSDIQIFRAIAFNDDSSTVETIFSVHSLELSETALSLEWACYSVQEGSFQVVLNARGRATGSIGTTQPEALSLSLASEDRWNMVPVDANKFYANLSKTGYGYSDPFRGVSNILRKSNHSVGTLLDHSGSSWEDELVCHPGLLDSALQTLFLAWSDPGDNGLWSLHVPVHLASVTINTYFTPIGSGGKQRVLQYETFIRQRTSTKVIGDIFLSTIDGPHATFAQLEGVGLVPFAKASERDDVPMFSQFHYQPASPDGILAARGETLSDHDIQLYKDAERISYWYIRNVVSAIPEDERGGLLPHFQRYLAWCTQMVNAVTGGQHPSLSVDANLDSHADIIRLLHKYRDRPDVRFLQVVGDHSVDVIREGTSMLEHMNNDGLLDAFYADDALCNGPTSRWLARIVSQIAFRYPGINIFEVGAGTGAATRLILREIGSSYNSYTFTDISSSFFLPAEEKFGGSGNRISFRIFDMEKEPQIQGYVEGWYDVVTAVNVLHVSTDVLAALSNVRRLLKPGGYLVVGELTSTDLLSAGMTFGTLPGWWTGAETGRRWGPLLSLGQWDSVLKQAGFSGIDTLTPDISTSLPLAVFATQAVNEQVSLLRNPLAAEGRPGSIQAHDLAIIGGTTPAASTLVQNISQELSHQFQRKQAFSTLEEFEISDMAARSSVAVLSVTDLDTPYLADLTRSKLSALQTLWAVAGNVVWVTCGLRQEVPWNSAMLGLTRVVRAEYPLLKLQIFDLEYTKETPHGIRESTAKDLAETLLRQQMLGAWDANPESLLWMAEPEVFMENDQHMIVRLLPDTEKNARYNSHRRDVFSQVDPRRESLRLVGTGTGMERTLEIHQVTPLALPSTSTGDNTRTVRITHSLLQNLSVGPAGFLRLCAGRDIKTDELVLALCPSDESPACVPSDWCLPLQTTKIASTLASVGASLIAAAILALTYAGSTLLVNEPDPEFQRALVEQARAKAVTPIFTFCGPGEEPGSSSIRLDPHLPRQIVKSIIPSYPSVFVHFSRSTRSDLVRDSILRVLPSACLKISEDTLWSHQPSSVPLQYSAKLVVKESLRSAWLDALVNPSTSKPDCIPLAEVSLHPAVGEPLAVVDWNSSESVTAKVLPIDSGTIFRPDGTYLLAGMAGELGQSLAEWMILHGARYVVLASRNPNENGKLVESMQKHHAAVIKFMRLDVTSRQSVWSCYSELKDTFPPIAGVINGAMVLDDELFANMRLEQFTRVTEPKVRGTELLDELFYNVALDFFIVTSSISSVIGRGGQGNYTAANEYMTCLVNKRRKRGLYAATINIPPVLGIGYAAQAGKHDMDAFQSMGYININAEDLHQLVAEAILSGRASLESGISAAQVCMGVNYRSHDPDDNRGATLGHFVSLPDDPSDNTKSSKTTSSRVRVKVQLASAKTAHERFDIVQDGFVNHLRRILHITEEEEDIDPSANLLEVGGIDSLVAVDVRAWFLKELDVDVPTLKILSGCSIDDLVQTAVEKLSPTEGEEQVSISSGSNNGDGGHGSDSNDSQGQASSRSTLFTIPSVVDFRLVK